MEIVATLNRAKYDAFKWRYELSLPWKLVLALGVAVLTGLLAQVKIPSLEPGAHNRSDLRRASGRCPSWPLVGRYQPGPLCRVGRGGSPLVYWLGKWYRLSFQA